ncbi:GSCOCG00013664001-RA-CDS, partial [Cotesia congregata]
MYHDDPLDKYPTLREDENGYYLLSQKAYPADCPRYCRNSTKCQKPKYSWIIREFTFMFKDNIEFSCDTDDPHHYDAKYNLTSLSSIKNEIVDKWEIKEDNYNCDSKDVLIRKYWEKQGMCSAYFKELTNEFKFYNKSLELFDKYNMGTILRQSNIVPGKNYTHREIHDAVAKGIGGKKVRVRCDHHFFGFQVLSIVEFVMDKNFNPTNPIDRLLNSLIGRALSMFMSVIVIKLYFIRTLTIL